jgi:RNA polymerase sigma-70 factor, ECF subfamily
MSSADKRFLEKNTPRETNVSRQDPISTSSQPLPAHGNSTELTRLTTEPIEAEIIDLLHKNAAALSRYAGSITRDKAIVQDGIQEAFLCYLSARVGGQRVVNPRAWLLKVLRNYILDCKRKENTMSAVNLEEAGQVADSRQDLEAGYQMNESFRRALSSLSTRERECMQLRLEGFGYREIADILGIRSGTVAALLARAAKKIRSVLLLGGDNG